jgi:hypothetical protein
MFRHSSRTRALNDSTYPLRQGSPGGMKCSPTHSRAQSAHPGAGQLGSVVAAQHGRVAARCGDAVELFDQVVAGDVAFDQAAETFTGVLVDYGRDHDRAAVGGGVVLEVDGPYLVRRVRGRQRRSGARTEAFATTPLWHPQAFFAPQALQLLGNTFSRIIDAGRLVMVLTYGPFSPGPPPPFRRLRQRGVNSTRVNDRWVYVFC